MTPFAKGMKVARWGVRRFAVRLTCCGRDDGEYIAEDWESADKFRESYLSGPGIEGHVRSAIIVGYLDPAMLTDGIHSYIVRLE